MVMETKLKALIGWLLKVKDSDPTSKCLVFTQFKHSMAWLSEELPKRGFTFRSLDGSMTQKAREDALLAFRDDPPTTVFLLSVRAGAVGINLTEANHVFFMEPLLNSAIEKQGCSGCRSTSQRRRISRNSMHINKSNWIIPYFLSPTFLSSCSLISLQPSVGCIAWVSAARSRW